VSSPSCSSSSNDDLPFIDTKPALHIDVLLLPVVIPDAFVNEVLEALVRTLLHLFPVPDGRLEPDMGKLWFPRYGVLFENAIGKLNFTLSLVLTCSYLYLSSTYFNSTKYSH
jgi:hypothetical protein